MRRPFYLRQLLVIVIDTEVYKDYFLFAAKNIHTGNAVHIDMFEGQALNKARINKIMEKNTTVSFNGVSFDLPIIVAALNGWNCQRIKDLANAIINSGYPSWKVCREWGITIPTKWDHIDLMDVSPGRSSLKIYGGRMNAPTIQDLPIQPDQSIEPHQRQMMRDYCTNDLDTTHMLYSALKPTIDLRAEMSQQYGMDLRSKSDAQIAETVIKSELEKLTDEKYSAPKLEDNYVFGYLDPKIVQFQDPQLRKVFQAILDERFCVGSNGSVVMPQWLRQTKIVLGGASYRMGIGGLHSCETRQMVCTEEDEMISDWDVASYYPNIVLQQRLSPKALGTRFLEVYQSIVERRMAAKKAGDKVTADTLKIAVNGSFGKLGSKYSALYAPDLLIQTTVTGQLALLMLIERMVAVGARVLSANTDGIVLHHKTSLEAAVKEVAWNWMLDTTYVLERTDYQVIASRDVNNYVAVKLDDTIKGKGCFAPTGLQKNPDQPIVYTAVAQHIAKGYPIEQTIRDCKDITQFCTVRRVTGGAQWRGTFLGKAVRFYLSTRVGKDECIHYSTNSNRVAKSAGAIPLMTLPDTFPDDVDYAAYVKIAEKLLCEVGGGDA
jgi:hypothetical protein